MNSQDYKKAVIFSNNFIKYFLNSKAKDIIEKHRHAAIWAGLLILFLYHQENKKLTAFNEEKIEAEHKLELEYFFQESYYRTKIRRFLIRNAKDIKMKFYETQFVFSHYIDTLQTINNAIEDEDAFVRKKILDAFDFINSLDPLEKDIIAMILGVDTQFWWNK